MVELVPILIANGGAFLLGGGPAIDGGIRLPDGRPLLGKHKTWRGFLAGLLSAFLSGILLGFPAKGLLMGLGAMMGDLLGSFLKRRLGLPEGAEAPLLDDLPYGLFGLLFAFPLLSEFLKRPEGFLTGVLLCSLVHSSVNYLLKEGIPIRRP